MIPILAREVRIIGGPTGPALGATGVTGPTAGLVAGATGWLGHIGHSGHTGLVGRAGDFSKFMGPSGLAGVTGPNGYPGPIGSIKYGLLFDGSYIANFQNLAGYSNFSAFANAVGCKFRYSVKNGPSQNGCLVQVFFNGLYIATDNQPFTMGIQFGIGGAPNSGDFGGYAGQNQALYTIQAQAGDQIPFYLQFQLSFYQPSDYSPNQFPQDTWFDLVGSPASGSGGKLINIYAVVFEVLL